MQLNVFFILQVAHYYGMRSKRPNGHAPSRLLEAVLVIFGLGTSELVVILLVVLVIFGPKNLPKIGTAIGQTVRNVKEGMEEDGDSASSATATAQVSKSEAIPDEDDEDLD